MAFLNFKSRASGRDAETDRLRFDQLRGVVVDVLSQVEREAAGLSHRYQRAAGDAAFSLQAAEDGGSTRLSRQADDLSHAMSRYSARIRDLRSHAEYLKSLQANIAGYADKRGS